LVRGLPSTYEICQQMERESGGGRGGGKGKGRGKEGREKASTDRNKGMVYLRAPGAIGPTGAEYGAQGRKEMGGPTCICEKVKHQGDAEKAVPRAN